MPEKRNTVIGINQDKKINDFDNFIGKLINKYS